MSEPNQSPKVSLSLPEGGFKGKRSPTPSPTQKRKTFFSNLLPQPNTSTASATGNPRNKCALKPGHSLMDWIRLGSSGVDLAGTRGVVTSVAHAELAKHNKRTDAWLAIRGKVYNVTQYVNFHPGGVDELMKGVGIDATKLFDEVHAWVNYEQLLQKCYIGPLRTTSLVDIQGPTASSSTSSSANLKITSSTSSSQLTTDSGGGGGLIGNGFRLPFSNSANFISSPATAAAAKSVVDGGQVVDRATEPPPLKSITNPMPPPQDEDKAPEIIVPRFDWIQKSSDLTIIFYTKSLCNPGLLIEYGDETTLEVKVIVRDLVYLFKFSLTGQVKWPCSIRNVIETGKVELTFPKCDPGLWSSYGMMEVTKSAEDLDTDSYQFDVGGCWTLSHDSYALVLKPVGRVLMVFPVGHHTSIAARIKGQEVVRSYTPVPQFFLGQPCPNSCIAMLVKAYEKGAMSRYLCQQSPSSRGLKLSAPRGSFSLSNLKSHMRISFLAAGSGITPFLGVIEHWLGKPNNQFESLRLHYFNKTEADIWCRSKLDALARKESRFNVQYVLSGADDKWSGKRGRVTEELVASITQQASENYATFIGVCGPPAFNYQIVEYLSSVGLPASAYHIFQG